MIEMSTEGSVSQDSTSITTLYVQVQTNLRKCRKIVNSDSNGPRHLIIFKTAER